MSKYFFTDGKEKYGPFTKDELRNQNISRKTKIWYYGLESWSELSNVPELIDVLKAIPPDIKLNSTNENITERIDYKTNNDQKQSIVISPIIQTKKKFTVKKWVLLIFAITLASVFSYYINLEHSDSKLYKEIVANSFDAEEDFDMYVQKFYRDLEFYGIYPKKPKVMIIKFSKLDQMDKATHIHALSYGFNDDDKIEIYINPSTWKKFSKPMRYILMYHELAHDVLNLDDLEATTSNKGKLMYPEISSYENMNMDGFIESFHALLEEHSIK